jgi:predicted nucleic acid-binding protein
MNLDGAWVDANRSEGLLIDTNLLVLFVVGSVNRGRIERFKRTAKYSEHDYELLLRVIERFSRLYTVAHVLAEVSNLTDLTGTERVRARRVLKETLSVLIEPEMPSARAAQSRPYEDLGLVDAAIAAVAREHKCAVLTDDLDLYLALSRESMPVLNFTHLRARDWGM